MSSAKPRVSVLMTIYNAEPYLRESIDSLIGQTLPEWELIAVDDGSTDRSQSILASYVDPRIRMFSFKENIGRTPALRYAFDQAESEYIAVLDADDLARSDRLAIQVEFLDDHAETVLVGSWAEHIDGQGRAIDLSRPPTDPSRLHDLLGRLNPIVHSSAMFRRDAAVEAGGYPDQYAFAQDFALILSLAKLGQIAVIGDHLCKLRIVPGSMTRSKAYFLVVLREQLALLKHAGRTLPLGARARVINRLKVLKCQFWYRFYCVVDRVFSRVTSW